MDQEVHCVEVPPETGRHTSPVRLSIHTRDTSRGMFTISSTHVSVVECE